MCINAGPSRCIKERRKWEKERPEGEIHQRAWIRGIDAQARAVERQTFFGRLNRALNSWSTPSLKEKTARPTTTSREERKKRTGEDGDTKEMGITPPREIRKHNPESWGMRFFRSRDGKNCTGGREERSREKEKERGGGDHLERGKKVNNTWD